MPEPASPVARLERRAPAKVNLYLRIVGRRADGYHLLDSLAVFVDLADRLSFSLAAATEVRLRGPFASAVIGENLVQRVARLLLAQAPATEASCAHPGARIEIEKNIPVAAGLGGGSADAAAALDGLNELWKLGLDEASLAALAPQLGADVPVCRFGRPALMSGIGEVIRAAPALPDFALLLVNPNRGVSTADVFARLAPPYASPLPLLHPPRDVSELASALRERGNDLAPAAIGLCPEIGEALRAMSGLKDCRLAQMSGSGATCFGLFDGLGDADRAAKEMQALRPHWFVRACQPQT